MDTNKKLKAEKLQAKLDKLVQTKEKKQAAFEKAKHELTAVSKEVDSVKFKLFEILQSGSDDVAFSSWAKRKIDESGKSEKEENAVSANSEITKSAKTEKGTSANHTKPIPQNQQTQTAQNQQPHTGQSNQAYIRP
jgi:hypothetical protein